MKDDLEKTLLERSSITKKSAYVTKWLISAIKEKRYKAEDRLPSERAIAASLNVSRTAVREALSSLQALGLVEPRVGEGNYGGAPVETWCIRKRNFFTAPPFLEGNFKFSRGR